MGQPEMMRDGEQSQPPTLASDVRFIARQPILDRTQSTYAYELLFRSGAADLFCGTDPESATRSTIDLSLLLGTQSLTEGRPAFINCTREALLSGIMRTLPKELIVIEVLEDVPADEDVVRECLRLKKDGYRIALDDIISSTDRRACCSHSPISSRSISCSPIWTAHDRIKAGKARGAVAGRKSRDPRTIQRCSPDGVLALSGIFLLSSHDYEDQ